MLEYNDAGDRSHCAPFDTYRTGDSRSLKGSLILHGSLLHGLFLASSTSRLDGWSRRFHPVRQSVPVLEATIRSYVDSKQVLLIVFVEGAFHFAAIRRALRAGIELSSSSTTGQAVSVPPKPGSDTHPSNESTTEKDPSLVCCSLSYFLRGLTLMTYI